MQARSVREHDTAVIGQIGRDLVLGISEMPGPGASARVTTRWEGLGGKAANQAVGLAQLGMRPALLAVVGDDQPGDELVRQAARDNIDVTNVIRREQTSTALLVDVVEESGTRRLLESVPGGTLVQEDDVHRHAAMIRTASTVVLQLQQPPATALAAAGIARDASRRLILDGASTDRDTNRQLVALANVVRADRTEAEQLVGRQLTDLDATRAAAAQLLEAGPALVVLAAGPAGNVAATASGLSTIPLLNAPVADPTGGGDAWIAGLTWALSRGSSGVQAAWCGAAAAALTVSSMGGRPALTADAVLSRLAREDGVKAASAT
jgi:ribokinase